MNTVSNHPRQELKMLPGPPWSGTWKLGFRFLFVFVVMFMLTLPFPHENIPNFQGMVAPFFEGIIKWVGDNLLRLNDPYSNKLISDSTGLYIHLLVLFVLALIAAIAWGFLDRKRINYRVLSYWFRVIMSYYLAFNLMVYGFNKIFKWQFYLPEPNTLFTTMGNTYRDLLYWSTMGTSHSYNMFMGILELIAALLLFFRKTRLLGALLSIGIMLNIVLINFSFDISVKVYSCFLLLLSILIAAPDARRLIAFFMENREEPICWRPAFPNISKRKAYYLVKTLVIAYMTWSVLTPYIRSGNYNDDRATRPPFHGAYDIPLFILNSDTLQPVTTDPNRWRRVFIHRRDYLIVQAMNDEMQDYDLTADTVSHIWKIRHTLTGEESSLRYEKFNTGGLFLKGKLGNDSVEMRLIKIDLDKLPVMQKEFNWTVD